MPTSRGGQAAPAGGQASAASCSIGQVLRGSATRTAAATATPPANAVRCAGGGGAQSVRKTSTRRGGGSSAWNAKYFTTPPSDTVLENNTPAGGDDDFELWDQNQMLRSEQQNLYNSRWGPGGFCRPSCIPISVIFILIVLVVLLPLLDSNHDARSGSAANGRGGLSSPYRCADSCRIQLVESIPEGMLYPPGAPRFLSTFDAWQRLIAAANRSIDIGTFYWELRAGDVFNHSSAWQGDRIFQQLLRAGTAGGVRVRIAQSQPTPAQPSPDTEVLQRKRAALVRSVNMPRLLRDGGVLHTKLWLVDGQHAYVGSANNDWRSLTQVKELGVLIEDCACLVRDVAKIWQVYWMMGKEEARVPPAWPAEVSTKVNATQPMRVEFNRRNGTTATATTTTTTETNETDTTTTVASAAATTTAPGAEYAMNVFFASAPPQFSALGRAQDIDAIVRVIGQAERFVYIAVMDYLPLTVYTPKMKYWGVIDDALRAAAIENRVQVRLLVSWWEHSRPAEDFFLRSLQSLTLAFPGVDVQVKRFVVTSSDDQKKIPYARVNHNKYMVTDRTAYIGTSNWSGDYFTTTAGIGLVMSDEEEHEHDAQTTTTTTTTTRPERNQTPAAANETEPAAPPPPTPPPVPKRTLRSDLQAVFERDWNSMYALDLAKA